MEVTGQEWIVLGVVAALIIALYTEVVRPAFAFLIAVIALVVTGIIAPKEALEGFANEQLAVIVMLLVLGDLLYKTKVVGILFDRMFKPNDSENKFRFKMMAGVGISSAFLNNTPLVAMLMPYVHGWSNSKGLSPSKFLIPLSFASILGGCVTLIGTSTNLIVNGLAVDSGMESLGIFDFAWVGIPMLVIGVIYLTAVAPKLLPDNKGLVQRLLNKSRRYFLETQVKAGSQLIGKTVEGGGLRSLKGMYVVGIVRAEKLIRPVNPQEILKQDDTLLLAGNPDSIADLTQPGLGLSLPKACDIPLKGKNDVVEVVIAHNSRLVGKKVQDSDFRGRYDGAILAIHRNGEKLWGKIGDVTLKAGDVLLVLTGKDFEARTEGNPAFYVISTPASIHNVEWYKVAVLLGGLFAAIALAAFGVVSLFVSLAVLMVVVLFLKIANPSEIRNSIDFNLIFIIALGIALGKGMVASGAAITLAESFVEVASSWGIIPVMAVIFLFTNVLSAFMTSKAAVAIVLPVALSVAMNMGTVVAEPELAKAFVLLVAFAGAANFLTPVGYQTNLMVYGPGGYSFRDFFKIGLPLTLIYMVVCILMLTIQFNQLI